MTSTVSGQPTRIGIANIPGRRLIQLDLSRLLPGPFATGVLADMGAIIDKIEDTEGGDYLRHLPPQIGADNAAFATLNRGKRSAVLNLKNPAAREAFAGS